MSTLEHNARILGEQDACSHSGDLQVNLKEKSVTCLECGFKWM